MLEAPPPPSPVDDAVRRPAVRGMVDGEGDAAWVLPRDVMLRVLERCDGDALLAASATCAGWAAMAEAVAEARCRSRRWVLPRRPRRSRADAQQRASSDSHWPWLAFWRNRRCRGCRGAREGEFPVRRSWMGPMVFLVCRDCARGPAVTRDNLLVDVESVQGNRDLVTEGRRAHGTRGRRQRRRIT